MSPFLLVAGYALLLGLAVGSFLNVVVHRVPRQTSLVSPRSRCPFCGARIGVRDNIPVVSYLLLRGRCRACSAPISPRYPAVEASTALLFLLAAWRFGASLDAAAAALFSALLLVLALIDVDHLLLPDKITLPGILAGLALAPFVARTTFTDAVLGVVLGAGTLILIINFWYWLRAEEGMGLGDVNMLAMIGAFLGWRGAAVALLAAVALGAVAGLGLLALGRLGWRSRLPFGLFLAIGGLVSLYAGERLAAAYLALA